MDPNLLLIGIGFLLTLAAWKKWFRERTSLTRGRTALFQLGLCATSLALVEYSVLVLYAHRIGGFGTNFASMLRWVRPGFFLSLAALGFSMTGCGRSRILAVAASTELVFIWIMIVLGM